MKRHLQHCASAIVLLLLVAPIAHAQTQLELNGQAADKFQAADKELNTTYQKILKQHKDDPAFIEKFKAAEKAWIAYRDAMAEAQFPLSKDEQYTSKYGSIYPLCYSGVQQRLTEEHIQELKQWLKPFEEGDVCSGERGLLLTN